MFPIDVWMTYTAACLLLVMSPGPDNLLAIGRGLSQGRAAAWVSGCASGVGTLFHVATATFGLTLLMQTSAIAFLSVKLIGAAYLLWLGIKVLRSRNLVSFAPAARQPLRAIFATGVLSAALNPKPGLFVLAFLPQFVSPERGSITMQMLAYGIWFAFLTAIGFSLMGMSAWRLSGWLQAKPRTVAGMNICAACAFIASGLSVAALKQK